MLFHGEETALIIIVTAVIGILIGAAIMHSGSRTIYMCEGRGGKWVDGQCMRVTPMTTEDGGK
jgi:hypothetical protein